MEKHSGLSLVTGAVLLAFTMAFHPHGGGIAYLQEHYGNTVISHAAALCAIPFLLFGFWGLTGYLGKTDYLRFGYIVFAFGAIAGAIAATFNGLIMPFFLKGITTDPGSIDLIKMILRYNLSINKAFDYIFIVAACISTLLWSVAIMLRAPLGKAIGYSGVFLSLTAIVLIMCGYVFTNLHGQRVFVFVFLLWTIATGVLLSRAAKEY